MKNIVDIKVWGEYACFTRPEFKVERVSYPVMTPSAARGILEAIYWKPKIRYRIQRIGILKFGSQWSLLRNEIASLQNKDAKGINYALNVLMNTEKEIKKAGKGKTKEETAEDTFRKQFILIDDDRQQRTSLLLKDVAYRIQAWIELRNGETNIGKHLDSFRRRAESGQYFYKPFMGCREFPAEFELIGDKNDNDNSIEPEEGLNLPIGTMLFDTAYIENPEYHKNNQGDHLEFWRHDNDERREAKGFAKRIFFNAEVKNGWLVEMNSDCLPKTLFDKLITLEDNNGTS